MRIDLKRKLDKKTQRIREKVQKRRSKTKVPYVYLTNDFLTLKEHSDLQNMGLLWKNATGECINFYRVATQR